MTKAWAGGPRIGPISTAFAAGQFVALLGPSGCGKTTTLKTINGLVTPDAGQVRIEGVRPGEAPHLLRRRIGYVFQEIGLFPHMSVADNIAVGPRLAGWPAARAAQRTAELLELMALPPEAGARMPAQLSGGQRQRVGLARALAAEPALMLLDEPFGALDPLLRADLGADYRGLHDRLCLTTIMVTHDVTEAVLLADRILVMEGGRVVADDSPGALLNDHPVAIVRALMSSVRERAGRVEVLARGAQERPG